MEIKTILKNCDLYDGNSTIELLQKKFEYISECNKSIPRAGSHCIKSKQINLVHNKIDITRWIKHRNNTVTLFIHVKHLPTNNEFNRTIRFHNLDIN